MPVLTRHSDTFSAFEVFEEVPDKSLKEYYKVIPDPTSLNKIQKRVRGLPSSGKGSGTGISDFKNWSDFEQETSLIWKNAMHYNEDGSEIFELARDLEVNLVAFLPVRILLTTSRLLSRS